MWQLNKNNSPVGDFHSYAFVDFPINSISQTTESSEKMVRSRFVLDEAFIHYLLRITSSGCSILAYFGCASNGEAELALPEKYIAGQVGC